MVRDEVETHHSKRKMMNLENGNIYHQVVAIKTLNFFQRIRCGSLERIDELLASNKS